MGGTKRKKVMGITNFVGMRIGNGREQSQGVGGGGGMSGAGKCSGDK